MDTRREFIKKAALLSGGLSFRGMMPPILQKALAIDPAPGSTFYDAEHIIFLMQENRSFDHIFGSLKGVRGFNDPRAIRLPNNNPVWLQTDKVGNTYAPFRLNTLDSKIAWMGSLPHGWSDQTDARNHGKYDRWLQVKQAKRKEYADIPLTLGYCTRDDFPFYYSLADAFTVCDHNFSSSLTGTHPNRHYWMTGSIRDKPHDYTSKAHVWNISDYYTPSLEWKTFTERLQESGVPWKIYQNDLTMGTAFSMPNESWLGNFGTNVMEYFKQYHVRLEAGRRGYLQQKYENVLELIASLGSASGKGEKEKLVAAKKLLVRLESERMIYTTSHYEQLSDFEKEINKRAFVTNAADPDFREMELLEYIEKGQERSLNVPKGDVLREFRRDVEKGTLPLVSWINSPANFSDHPGLPWFGPAYVSEVMDILLKNPEVWKKTVIVMTYDENDGFFDHLPPFVVPDPYKKDSGKVSSGIDARLDFATEEQQLNTASSDKLRHAPLGLGYRVPMILVSPWTRGGYVCSEVFDHTSSIQFVEKFLSRKLGKTIHEDNITAWRRTICGDLSSAFRQYNSTPKNNLNRIDKNAFLERVNDARYKDLPQGYKRLDETEVAAIRNNPLGSPHLPRQEKGIRPACALPYELYLDGIYEPEAGRYSLHFEAGNRYFGDKSAGAPFYVYASMPGISEDISCRNYAVKMGDRLQDGWRLSDFRNGEYYLKAYGPNGFYRSFRGGAKNLGISVRVRYAEHKNSGRPNGSLLVILQNNSNSKKKVILKDGSYKQPSQRVPISPGEQKKVQIDLSKSYGWYDVIVTVEGQLNFEEQFAGKVETGEVGKTDPLMGGLLD